MKLEEFLSTNCNILGYYRDGNEIHIGLHYKSDVDAIISGILIHSDCKLIKDKGIKLIVELEE